jgi:deoxycytidine triphosphate deaminase
VRYDLEDFLKMIITASEINRNIKSGEIVIEPYSRAQLGTVSYKFKIGNKIAAIKHSLDSKELIELVFEEIPQNGYLLEPNILYLAQTYEVMGSSCFAQQIFAVRDIGSAGIFIHISADLGHSGAITQWTLEITTDHYVYIYPYQFIGQIIFWKLDGEVSVYQGEYNNMSQSLPSKYWKEFE